MIPHGTFARIAILGAIALIGAAVLLALLSDSVRWRAVIVVAKATGQIENIGWTELLPMLQRGSPVDLESLATTRNPYVAVRSPHDSDADREAGAGLFRTQCASCHGANAEGQIAPSLVGRLLKAGDSDWSLYLSVTRGMPELGMPPARATDREAWQIVSFVRGLRNGVAAVSGESGASSGPIQRIAVPAARIEGAASEPHNWLTYSGSYESWRRTALDEINSENVADLKLAWVLQLGGLAGAVEASPIVVDGIMYLSAPASDVLAVDAATGDVRWRYERKMPKNLPLCCGAVNRGVAVLDDRVFIGTLDNFAVALDAQTGRVVWETKVADYHDGYTITAAPLAVRGKVIIGVAGGEYGVRGFLDAYDASTGKRAWRFHTIPEPGQFGSDTWSGDSWKTGGGPTWLTGSFDSSLGLLYWGVGNPAPNFNGDVRPLDNLFTNSVIALDVDSGKLKWHFQFTPHDEHDWDANQIPVLVDHDFKGQPRRLMLWANRNGFYYVLDRATGEFLHAVPFVTQNWAKGIDPKGRPVLLPSAEPSRRGTLTWPGLAGGANWWAPSYSPEADLLYVPFADSPTIFFKGSESEPSGPREGMTFAGSVYLSTKEGRRPGIAALKPVTGELAWEYRRRKPSEVGRIGGTLASAGNLVFFGDMQDFLAVDARTGRELWRVNLGGLIRADPVSFAVDGQQRVAIAAGNALYVFRR